MSSHQSDCFSPHPPPTSCIRVYFSRVTERQNEILGFRGTCIVKSSEVLMDSLHGLRGHAPTAKAGKRLNYLFSCPPFPAARLSEDPLFHGQNLMILMGLGPRIAQPAHWTRISATVEWFRAHSAWCSQPFTTSGFYAVLGSVSAPKASLSALGCSAAAGYMSSIAWRAPPTVGNVAMPRSKPAVLQSCF